MNNTLYPQWTSEHALRVSNETEKRQLGRKGQAVTQADQNLRGAKANFAAIKPTYKQKRRV